MANAKSDDTQSSIEQHVREILARLSAFQARLRAQQQARGLIK
jgi:hypothetical protein